MFDTMKRLSEILDDRGMTLADLCRESGLHYSGFTALKRRKGQLSLPTIEIACEVIGCPLFEFFATERDWAMIENYSSYKREIRKTPSVFQEELTH